MARTLLVTKRGSLLPPGNSYRLNATRPHKPGHGLGNGGPLAACNYKNQGPKSFQWSAQLRALFDAVEREYALIHGDAASAGLPVTLEEMSIPTRVVLGTSAAVAPAAAVAVRPASPAISPRRSPSLNSNLNTPLNSDKPPPPTKRVHKRLRRRSMKFTDAPLTPEPATYGETIRVKSSTSGSSIQNRRVLRRRKFKPNYKV